MASNLNQTYYHLQRCSGGNKIPCGPHQQEQNMKQAKNNSVFFKLQESIKRT